MNDVPPFSPAAMTFIARTSAHVFQSPSRAKAVTVGHEPLHRQAGQLRQAVQIFERRGEAFEAAGVQKHAQAQFNACAFAQ